MSELYFVACSECPFGWGTSGDLWGARTACETLSALLSLVLLGTSLHEWSTCWVYWGSLGAAVVLCWLHFTDGESEAPGVKDPCPSTHTWEVLEQGLRQPGATTLTPPTPHPTTLRACPGPLLTGSRGSPGSGWAGSSHQRRGPQQVLVRSGAQMTSPGSRPLERA